MIAAVFDCNVLMAALGWRSEPYHCLVQVAQKRAQPYVTDFILEEYRRTALSMEAKGIFPRSPWPAFEWFVATCKIVDPAPLGRQRSRDANDDPYIACALSAKAKYIVTRDPDLLILKKPFGIVMSTPRLFLNHLAGLS